MKTPSIAAVLLLSALGANLAWANTTFTLDPSTLNNNSWDGIYLSPYTVDISANGGPAVPTLVICDDFTKEVTANETWQVTASTVANLALTQGPGLNPVSWYTDPNAQADYNEAAWLATQLVNLSPTATNYISQEAYLSYAIWAVFDPTGVKDWLTQTNTDQPTWDQVQLKLNQASEQTYTTGEFSNVSVYTPLDGTESCCGRPQEFLAVQTVRADEASTIATFGFDFTCLAVLLYFFRRQLSAKLN